MTWRQTFRPIIAAAIQSVPGRDPKELRRALRDAYDAHLLSPRKYYVYKAWCKEVRVQLGLERPRPARTRREEPPQETGQLALFEEVA